jgi:hypothetical protein
LNEALFEALDPGRGVLGRVGFTSALLEGYLSIPSPLVNPDPPVLPESAGILQALASRSAALTGQNDKGPPEGGP